MRTHHRQRGSVFQRKQADGSLSDRWSIKYRDPSGRQVVEVVGKKKREALDILERRLTAMRAGTYKAQAEQKQITFKEYAPRWLETRRPSLKPSTHRTFEAILGLVKGTKQRRHASPVKAFGDQLLDAIEAPTIAAYLASLSVGGLRPKSVNNTKTLLSSLFEDAKAEQYTTVNPVKSRLVKAAKVLSPDDREERIIPTPAQVAALLNYLDRTDPRLFAFAFTMAGIGCRPGEAAAIQVKHLSPAVGQVSITQSFDPRPRRLGLPKNGLTREVDAGPAVFSALQRVGDHSNPEAFILAEPDGTPLRFDLVRKRWAAIQAAAGCGSWPSYSLRHYCASRMLQEGESIAYVAKQLGHSRQSMTLSHYSKFIPDRKRERGADRLAAELLAPQAAPVPEMVERLARYQNVTNSVTNTPKQA
jgi:integrase